MLIQAHFDLWHYLEVLVGAGTIFIPLWWANRETSRKNHTQNLTRLNYLINETMERPHHKHMDGQPGDTGPLQAEHIAYPPRQFNDK
jgi:hypothetical protein